MNLIPENFDTTCMECQNLFFVHVPKCGGSYLTQVALANYCDSLVERKSPLYKVCKQFFHQKRTRVYWVPHPVCTAQDLGIAKYNRAWTRSCVDYREFQQSIAFSVVRNPFDLLVSMYTYGFPYRRPRPEKPKPELDAIGFPFETFAEFVRAYCNDAYSWIVKSQQRFLFFQLFADDGMCAVKYVLRLESLDAGLKRFLRPFGITPIVSDNYVNCSRVGKKTDYRTYYTDELRSLVEQKCSRELEAFGYTFDGHDDRMILDTSSLFYNPHTDEYRGVHNAE